MDFEELVKPEYLDGAANSAYIEFIDEIILGVVFDVHRALKFGIFEEYIEEEDSNLYTFVENRDADIFGQHLKKSPVCSCPCCDRRIGASKLASHLEKCMNMGRHSSRLASQRIAKNSKKNAYGGMLSDDDEEEWLTGSEKAKLNRKLENRKKRDKNAIRNKNQKLTPKEVTVVIEQNDEVLMKSENLNTINQVKKRKNGVIGSVNIPNKTSGKNVAGTPNIYNSAKNNNNNSNNNMNYKSILAETQNQLAETMLTDVENIEEMDSNQTWEHENSNTSSPTDSASTGSSSSKKRK